jgi:hypothetical protein
MRVQVTRRGGLAGIPLHGELETAELPPEQARAAEEALRQLPADRAPSPPTHPDAFQYDIAFSDAGVGARTVTLDETELTDDLRPIIDTAMSRGTLG